jgi:hypothetical protein
LTGIISVESNYHSNVEKMPIARQMETGNKFQTFLEYICQWRSQGGARGGDRSPIEKKPFSEKG